MGTTGTWTAKRKQGAVCAQPCIIFHVCRALFKETVNNMCVSNFFLVCRVLFKGAVNYMVTISWWKQL